ncbi:HPr kinase/phosphatase C-terminal domain-containing protein [Rhodovulum sulfidophilum]|uniref:HPr kinase/phosphorylase n=1 Tax=Rhodovulum sulfidophilum TaxID=35806 RepID=UPI001920FE05|nr:HPr kinase/phosphatase C-terminal domain-containing protein [Rhodovulum sulfidophilum]MBL3594370.1 HPr kinase/phosphatase C-terminal domain-containing protein [Rhodovulum sulfidophilum]
MPDASSCILHASTVAHRGRAVLIRGASGAGKSALALQLMALRAELVADDRTILTRTGSGLLASAPEAIRGLIEARHVGLLRAEAVASAPVVLAVDLDSPETERLPPARVTEILGESLPLLRRVDRPYFAAAILQYLIAGPSD